MRLLAQGGQAQFRWRDDNIWVRLIPQLYWAESGTSTLSAGGGQGRCTQTGFPYATPVEAAFVAPLRLYLQLRRNIITVKKWVCTMQQGKGQGIAKINFKRAFHCIFVLLFCSTHWIKVLMTIPSAQSWSPNFGFRSEKRPRIMCSLDLLTYYSEYLIKEANLAKSETTLQKAACK